MTDASAGTGTPTATDVLKTSVPVALQLGWVMSLLFGPFDRTQPVTDRLPTERELEKPERVAVELSRLDALVGQLNGLLPPGAVIAIPGTAGLAKSDEDALADDGTRQSALQRYNQTILESLARAAKQLGLAYQLGRSLRRTVLPLPPTTAPGSLLLRTIRNALRRERVVRIQGWLSTLDASLSTNAATVVAKSLGRWSDWAETVIDADGSLALSVPDEHGEYVRAIGRLLLQQGDVWLNFLVGAQSTEGLLTPESMVAAGEDALARTGRIVRRVIAHNWIALVVVAVVLGLILWAVFANLAGAAKVWTGIASIAGALGVTVNGIRNSVVRLSTAAERPIYLAAEVDAMAWAVTTLPREDKLDGRVREQLRRDGIQTRSPLGRA
jgi:hypothetical protein